jgi:2-oxoglutarate ferredoxin oxidoreductase subunit alpha
LSHEILKEEKTPTYLRNCYSSEESFAKVLTKNIYDWKINKEKIVESESYKTSDAREIIIAHGLVAAAAKEAVNMMRLENKKVGLFRPITINPIDTRKLRQLLPKIKVVHIFESSLSQFSRIVKYEAYGLDTPIIEHPKPAEEFTAQEIINLVERM